MRVTSHVLTGETLGRIARQVAAQHYGGNLTVETEHVSTGPRKGTETRVKLGAANSRMSGARESWTGRKGPWSCWHVFRDVFAAWLIADPSAVIRTGVEVYRGAAGFLEAFPATAYRNVGSMVQPAYMTELCSCSGPDDGGPLVDALRAL